MDRNYRQNMKKSPENSNYYANKYTHTDTQINEQSFLTIVTTKTVCRYD